MKFAYQWEKLSAARSCLMLPHSQGEEQSIANAFHALSLGFNHFDDRGLDEDARRCVSKLKEMMDTSSLDKTDDPKSLGLWFIKASSFTVDDKLELSRLVDELASWFDREMWSSVPQNL